MRRGLPKEPSVKGMLFTATSGAVLGILLGGVILLKEMPTKGAPAEGSANQLGAYTAQYSLGSVAAAESPTMKLRMSALTRRAPGPIKFSEAEVNYFLSQFKSAAKDEEGNPANLSIGSPNVSLKEGAFVLNSKVIVNPTSDRFELMVQAYCRFEKSSDGHALKVDRLLMNSLKVPPVGGYVQDAFTKQLASISWPAELAEAWNAAREIQVLENSLIIVL